MGDGDTPADNAGNTHNLWAQLRANPRLPLIVGVAATAAILFGLFLWSSAPQYGVLFSGLADRDGGRIVAKLDQMNEPYKFAAGGATILVPSADVDRIRLKLAGQGLPQGGGVGFKLMDDQPLGISQFAEHINYQRALQGELANTIESLSTVAGARVSLAIPKSSVFVRQRKQPSASVVLKLFSGRALADTQVSAITHLVSSAVPGLPAARVTVVDGDGNLLSQSRDSSGASASQLEYASRVERTLRDKIHSLLAPIVGDENFRVRVNADLNFARNEATREHYTPNQSADKQAVRSRQDNVEGNGGSAGASGIPGALSNKPSPETASPINNPKSKQQKKANSRKFLAQTRLADANNRAAKRPFATRDAPAGAAGSVTRSTVTNYELDHTIEHVKQPVGRLRRVSAAVVINSRALGAAGADPASADTDKQADKPTGGHPGLSAAHMRRIKKLVRGAIGFSGARGDTVQVMQMPFAQAAGPQTAPEPPWLDSGQAMALGFKLLKYLIVAIVAWLLWRKLVAPLLAQAPQLPGRRALGAADSMDRALDQPVEEIDEQTRLARQRNKQRADAVDASRNMARNDPRMVAMIVKNWMSGRG